MAREANRGNVSFHAWAADVASTSRSCCNRSQTPEIIDDQLVLDQRAVAQPEPRLGLAEPALGQKAAAHGCRSTAARWPCARQNSTILMFGRSSMSEYLQTGEPRWGTPAETISSRWRGVEVGDGEMRDLPGTPQPVELQCGLHVAAETFRSHQWKLHEVEALQT